MKAGEKMQKEENSLSSAAMGKSAGISFLEALFIRADPYGSNGRQPSSFYPKDPSDKISTATENGEAIAQWLRSAYLLKQISTPSDNAPCAKTSINTELACFQDIIGENGVILYSAKPFFPGKG